MAKVLKADVQSAVYKKVYVKYADLFNDFSPFWGFVFLEYVLGKDHAKAIRYYLDNGKSFEGYPEGIYLPRAITYYTYIREHGEGNVLKKPDNEINQELNDIFIKDWMQSTRKVIQQYNKEDIDIPSTITSKLVSFLNKKSKFKKVIASLYSKHNLNWSDFKKDVYKFSANVYLNAVKYKDVSPTPFASFLYEQEYFKNINITFHDLVEHAPEIIDIGFYYFECEDVNKPFIKILTTGYKTLQNNQHTS